jgi:hypothetical protein
MFGVGQHRTYVCVLHPFFLLFCFVFFLFAVELVTTLSNGMGYCTVAFRSWTFERKQESTVPFSIFYFFF